MTRPTTRNIVLDLPFTKSSRTLLMDTTEHQLSKKRFDEHKLIYRLVCGGKWDDVVDAMLSIKDNDCESYHAILHFACRFHPPQHIVRLLNIKFRGSISTATSTGKYPIHFAAEYGAPSDVIAYLAEEDPSAAAAQDVTGMTPLHHLCQTYMKRHQPQKDGGRKTKKSMREAIKALIKFAPESLNLEDMYGMNVIEWAIKNEVDIKLVRELQSGCVRCKRRQSQSPSDTTTRSEHNLKLEQQFYVEIGHERGIKKISSENAIMDRRTAFASFKRDNPASSNAVAA